MVTVTPQDASVDYNRRIVLASSIIVLIVSNASYILRLIARRKQGQTLKSDDYIMGLALPFSYIPVVCMFYGLTVGLGQHVGSVSKPDLKKFNISLFVLQRGNPPCLLCVKTSILILYARLFPTKTFKRVAFGVWLFTLFWAISAFFSNLLQCTPVAFFWDKTIEGGKCLPNALITVGMTNGVLSFVGDLVILALPLPMVWKLQINKRRKYALSGMFLLGGFVCVTSVFRFIALASINVKDITFTQVAPGVWTYIELGIGITCGNLPLLRPLCGKFFSSNKGTSTTPYYGSGYAGNSKRQSTFPGSRAAVSSRHNDGFRKMHTDVESQETGSEVELNNTNITGGRHRSTDASDIWHGDGITVKTDVDLKIEEVRRAIQFESEKDKHSSRSELGVAR